MQRKTKTIKVMLTPNQREELIRVAAKEQRTMSDLLAWLLSKYIEKEKAS
jgi:hypothetical protein